MDRFELPIEEILEALDLSRAEPGLGFLQALFERFVDRVPFETASKILRNIEVADPAEKPRSPPIFWREHLEKGAGGTCFARVAAFEALLRELGFSARKVFGRVERDFDHAALLVQQGGRVWICDVGFPLPALLPAGETTVETPFADLSVAPAPRGYRIDFLGGVPEGPRTVEIFEGDVSEESFRERWRATFRPESRFLTSVALRRQEASRIVSFSRGEIRVDDRHSRLTLALPPPRARRLSEMFLIEEELLRRAFLRAGDPEAAEAGSRVRAYLDVPASPQAAFDAIGSLEAYRRLLEGVAAVTSEEKTASGWRVELAAPREAAASHPSSGLIEEVSLDPARRALRVRRTGGAPAFSESEFRVEQRDGRTYLVREALFESFREDLLRNDSFRGRLAGTLALDLLAWARWLARETPASS